MTAVADTDMSVTDVILRGPA